jgi:hypothetical protein
LEQFQVVNKRTDIPTQHYLYMHLVSFIISDNITQFTKPSYIRYYPPAYA